MKYGCVSPTPEMEVMGHSDSESSDASFEIVSAEGIDDSQSITPSFKPSIIFHDIFDVYPMDADIVASVSASDDYKMSADDKVVVVPLAWTSVDQAVCVSKLNGFHVKFDVHELPKTPADRFYQLCYCTGEGNIVGVSTPFFFREVHEEDLMEFQKEHSKEFWTFRSRFAVLTDLYWNAIKKNYEITHSDKMTGSYGAVTDPKMIDNSSIDNNAVGTEAADKPSIESCGTNKDTDTIDESSSRNGSVSKDIDAAETGDKLSVESCNMIKNSNMTEKSFTDISNKKCDDPVQLRLANGNEESAIAKQQISENSEKESPDTSFQKESKITTEPVDNSAVNIDTSISSDDNIVENVELKLSSTREHDVNKDSRQIGLEMAILPKEETEIEVAPPKGSKVIKTAEKSMSPSMKACEDILKDIYYTKLEDFAWPFYEPTIGELVDYRKIVTHPMDLGMVHWKVRRQEYKSIHDFASDVRLIFSNCYKYYPEDRELMSNAKKLEDYFNTEFAKVSSTFPDIPSANKTGTELFAVTINNGEEKSSTSSSESSFASCPDSKDSEKERSHQQKLLQFQIKEAEIDKEIVLMTRWLISTLHMHKEPVSDLNDFRALPEPIIGRLVLETMKDIPLKKLQIDPFLYEARRKHYNEFVRCGKTSNPAIELLNEPVEFHWKTIIESQAKLVQNLKYLLANESKTIEALKLEYLLYKREMEKRLKTCAKEYAKLSVKRRLSKRGH